MLKYERFRIDVNDQGHYTNTYIVYDDESREAILIDPATASHVKASPIFKFIQKCSLDMKCIVLTHCHGDHICGVDIIKELLDIPVSIYSTDEPGYKIDNIAYSSYLGLPHPKSQIDFVLDDGDEITLGNYSLKIIHTPGHTQGSICLYAECINTLFSGDTVFADSYGRTDLPTGSQEEMALTLTSLIEKFPDVNIAPGHGCMGNMSKTKRYLVLLLGMKNKKD